MANNSGIYKIFNIINNKYYVGSAVLLNARWNTHKCLLRRKTHYNKHLQAAWNKYGENNFIFEIIEKCEKEKLIEREQYYIDLLKPEYNKLKKAFSSLGYKHTSEALKKMRTRVVSEENKKRISEFFKGHTPRNKDKKLSKEHKEKLSYKRSEEHKNKISKSLKNKKLSEEHKQKVSNSIKEWWKLRKNGQI